MEYGAGSPAAMLEGDWVMRALYRQAFCSSRPKILVIVRIGSYKVGRREGVRCLDYPFDTGVDSPHSAVLAA